MPNFFIIGAPKCGTTSMAAWLAEHPNIYMSPIKEPFYFSKDIGNHWRYGWDEYLRLFYGADHRNKAIGEASTFYLISKIAIPTIEKKIPGARYIVMLRNPVEMVYSLYKQQVRVFNENIESFSKAWELVPERQKGRRIPSTCKDPKLLDYPAWCRLGEQLERLYALVPRERVQVVVLDDVKQNPRQEYLKVLDFLGVIDDGRQEFPVHNQARDWRYPQVGRAIRVLGKAVGWSKHVKGLFPRRSLGIVGGLQALNTKQKPRPPLPPDLSSEIFAFFDEDLVKLENILGRKFSQWRSSDLMR